MDEGSISLSGHDNYDDDYDNRPTDPQRFVVESIKPHSEPRQTANFLDRSHQSTTTRCLGGLTLAGFVSASAVNVQPFMKKYFTNHSLLDHSWVFLLFSPLLARIFRKVKGLGTLGDEMSEYASEVEESHSLGHTGISEYLQSLQPKVKFLHAICQFKLTTGV